MMLLVPPVCGHCMHHTSALYKKLDPGTRFCPRLIRIPTTPKDVYLKVSAGGRAPRLNTKQLSDSVLSRSKEQFVNLPPPPTGFSPIVVVTGADKHQPAHHERVRLDASAAFAIPPNRVFLVQNYIEYAPPPLPTSWS